MKIVLRIIAHQVEIHKKPGFDPCEMFFDPRLRFPKLKVLRRVLQKLLGFRYVMDVISTDPSLIRGSHGVYDGTELSTPVLMSSVPELLPDRQIDSTEVCGLILDHLFTRDRS
ncbi:MAG: hypothetical protein ACFHHU_03380 [Porticoccaceae bacterium]